MSISVQINERFCGPPNSGNGGYVSGLIANHVGPNAKVRLHAPPPLNQSLSVFVSEDRVELKSESAVLGTGYPNDLELTVPSVPSYQSAVEAQTRFVSYRNHVFPCCFVCGPERNEGDGMRIFPGPVDPDNWDLLACIWEPSADLLNDSGKIRREFIWAALDCPSYFGVMAQNIKKALLGEFELKIEKDVNGNQRFVIFCWPIARDGRKYYGGSALATADGEIIAFAKGTWLEPRE